MTCPRKKLVIGSAVLVSGIVLTIAAAGYMETVRGGPAFGGEYLILPGMILLYKFVSDVKGDMKMCSICGHNPCLPGCPNAPEPKAVHRCSECGDGIYEGDRYLEVGGDFYCEYCLDDMSKETLLDICGYEMKTAEERGPVYD